MKNQYFGDINDYRKYGLLRMLSNAGLVIGVCWLLTRNDDGLDGERRSYLLKPSSWRKYDSDLYDRLRRLQQSGVHRTVQYAREWDLIPGATYFDDVLSDNLGQRDIYFSAALKQLHNCDVLFFDPDNGIEVQSTRRGRRGSARYVYWTELQEAYSNGHSLLVYQHFPRVEREPFVRFLADRLADELRAARVTGFTTPHVAFFLVHQSVHRAALERAVAAVLPTWQGQFDIWPQAVETVHGDFEKVVAMPMVGRASPGFTAKQGQYLAFIYYYSKIHGTAPAEADLARYFRVSAPAAHHMIVTLTARGLIKRTPGQARSIQLGVSRAELPDLE